MANWRGYGEDCLWWGNWSGFFLLFLVGAFAGGLKNGVEVVGVVFFGWKRSSWCASWQGNIETGVK